MYLIRGTNNIELFRSNFPEISTVATIGNFDGLHLGHQQILKTMQKEADKAIEDFATGKTRNIHETMIAVNKADLAFRLTMQVRNKIVEAYQEVMRTQI